MLLRPESVNVLFEVLQRDEAVEESRLEQRPLRQRLLTGPGFEPSRELQHPLVEIGQDAFEAQRPAVHALQLRRKPNGVASLDGELQSGVQQAIRALDWLALLADGNASEAVALGAGPIGLRVAGEDLGCKIG